MFDAALAQIPEPLRRPDTHGRVAVLVRTDGAGATKAFAAHVAAAGAQFSLGANLGHFDIVGALAGPPKTVWTPRLPGPQAPRRRTRRADRAPRRRLGRARPPAWSTCPPGHPVPD